MFTDSELKLLEWALEEIQGWLETDEDFQDFENICEKLNIEIS